MTMGQRVVDTRASEILIRTRAEGMLARLAHDLEIRVADFKAEVEREEERWRIDLRIPVDQLHVAGVLKRGRVDTNTLSAREVREIEKKIRREVFAGLHEVRVDGSGHNAEGDLTVHGPRGTQSLFVRLNLSESSEDHTVVQGRLSVSLRRLGIKEVKAPLGAFKVSDAIEIEGRLVLGE